MWVRVVVVLSAVCEPVRALCVCMCVCVCVCACSFFFVGVKREGA